MESAFNELHGRMEFLSIGNEQQAMRDAKKKNKHVFILFVLYDYDDFTML